MNSKMTIIVSAIVLGSLAGLYFWDDHQKKAAAQAAAAPAVQQQQPVPATPPVDPYSNYSSPSKQ